MAATCSTGVHGTRSFPARRMNRPPSMTPDPQIRSGGPDLGSATYGPPFTSTSVPSSSGALSGAAVPPPSPGVGGLKALHFLQHVVHAGERFVDEAHAIGAPLPCLLRA